VGLPVTAPSKFRPGDRLIIFFDTQEIGRSVTPDEVLIHYVAPYDDENVETARLGASQDERVKPLSAYNLN
jgi:hypothetical protein